MTPLARLAKASWPWLLLLAGPGLWAARRPPPPPARLRADAILDRMARHERDLVHRMQHLRPRLEVYLQDFRPHPQLGSVPVNDRYFLGRLGYRGKQFQLLSFLPRPQARWRSWLGPISDGLTRPLFRAWQMNWVPNGFVRMLFPDPAHLDRRHYRFRFVRRALAGHLTCYLFDVAPRRRWQQGGFLGRLWIEHRHDYLVRYDGVLWGSGWTRRYLHFDGWRVNCGPRLWLPAYVYSEETGKAYGFYRTLHYRAQLRLWGYDLRHAGRRQSLTHIRIEGPQIKDPPPRVQLRSPQRSRQLWERQAENNVLDRLERAGLIAPAGPVTQVLQKVATNLVVSNDLRLRPGVRCRVLLTTPLESFTIGHTIVLSRGLIDTLPNEPDLAAMLAHELAHIVLDQKLNARYAFADRMLIPDSMVISHLRLRDSAREEREADRRAWQLLEHSPYRPQLAAAGLYLRALALEQHRLPHLLRPLFGNRMFFHGQLRRLHELLAGAAPLQPNNLNQMAALPLGSRLAVNPWNDVVSMENHRPLELLSPRDKMPFELAPLFPVLSRLPKAAAAAHAHPPVRSRNPEAHP